MTRNMGIWDRRMRALLIAPLAVIGGLLAGPGTPVGVVLLVVGAVMLATGAVGFCPLYRLFGIRTDGGGIRRA